jgi:hypothetical protein
VADLLEVQDLRQGDADEGVLPDEPHDVGRAERRDPKQRQMEHRRPRPGLDPDERRRGDTRERERDDDVGVGEPVVATLDDRVVQRADRRDRQDQPGRVDTAVRMTAVGH